jgi:peptidyl-prolyl cis-trans isomerase SurA
MNFKSIHLGLIIFLFVAGCTVFKQNEPDTDVLVGIVNGENIYLSQLLSQFYRSGVRPEIGSTETEVEEIKDFLPLYIDYRAKLASARSGSYFNDPEILEELRGYETQTAFPYWLENKVREQLLDEFISRTGIEIAASHMLITLPQNPSRADTLRAYNRLLEAREKAMQGENFDSLSVVYSSMQQGRSVGGDLGRFTVGWAVKDFEDVAFNTAPGEISMPFRTQFGYHIVKVHEVTQTIPDHLVSHIFFQATEQNKDEVLEQAREAYLLLTEQGLPWAEVVEAFTQDMQSARNSGAIGWVNNGRLNQSNIDRSFTDVAMAIGSVGDVSEPFFSSYGVHILRLDSVKTYSSDQQFRDEMMAQLRSLPRYRENRSFTLTNIRTSGSEFVNRETLDQFENILYENGGASFSALQISDTFSESPVYRINNQWYTVSDYLAWLVTQLDTTSTNNYHYSQRERFFDYKAELNAVEITKTEFPEFADLSREYLNGLVIFKITEDSVWNYARVDTVSVLAMFEAAPENYRFGERYFYFRIAANNDSTLTVAIDALVAGLEPDSLRNEISNILVRADVVNDLSQEPFSVLDGLQPGEISERFDYRNRRTVFLLDRIEPARNMTIEEAFFRVVSDYQPIREDMWMQGLRLRYNVTMLPENITAEAFERLRN